jgi:hypothetical protein
VSEERDEKRELSVDDRGREGVLAGGGSKELSDSTERKDGGDKSQNL